MKKDLLCFGPSAAYLLLWAIVLLTGPGCAPKKEDLPKISTGVSIPAFMVDIRLLSPAKPEIGTPAFTPDAMYAEVNSAWLPGFYERWKKDLFAKDVVGWEGRFDCNKFAASYCAAAQMEFYRDRWGTRDPAQALLIGEIWYMPDAEAKKENGVGHAIVVAITERGAICIEPQTGKEVKLSATEWKSNGFKRF